MHKKHNPRRTECSYYDCHEIRGLRKCWYCGKLYCGKHIRARPTSAPPWIEPDKWRVELGRQYKDAHACPDFTLKPPEPVIISSIKPHHYPPAPPEQMITTDLGSKPGPIPLAVRILRYIRKLRFGFRRFLNALYETSPFRTISISELAMDFIYFAISVILTLVVYNNIESLNKYTLSVLNIGSVLLIVTTFLALRYLYRIFKNLKWGFDRMHTAYKFLTLVALLALSFNIYQNQVRYVSAVEGRLEGINFSQYNPAPTLKLSFLQGVDTHEVELAVFAYTNIQREQNGLPDLKWNDKLAEIAREHSQDMAKNKYFSHTDLNGEDPTARAAKAGYSVMKPIVVSSYGSSYQTGIAENINKMPTGTVQWDGGERYIPPDADSIAKALVESWMESPGHRANILNPTYDSLGVGVAYDGQYYLATQDFS